MATNGLANARRAHAVKLKVVPLDRGPTLAMRPYGKPGCSSATRWRRGQRESVLFHHDGAAERDRSRRPLLRGHRATARSSVALLVCRPGDRTVVVDWILEVHEGQRFAPSWHIESSCPSYSTMLLIVAGLERVLSLTDPCPSGASRPRPLLREPPRAHLWKWVTASSLLPPGLRVAEHS